MKKAFKILSIDGGGIKGLYSSRILEHLEEQFGGHLSDYFDMLCGTSTGGLIALALSQKIPVETISNLYFNKGDKIFSQKFKRWKSFKQKFFKGKYSDENLKSELKGIFKEKKIGDSNNLLCIPSYSITDGRPWVFKFDHVEGEMVRDNKTPYVDIALATTAAPTYLPIAEIPVYDNRQFIDGGVWANNPTMIGVIEALHHFVGEGKEFNEIKVLSISSLNKKSGVQTGASRHKSFLDWKADLFETSLIGQQGFTDYFMNNISRIIDLPVSYVRIPSAHLSSEQEKIIDLDFATKDSLNLISALGNDSGVVARKKPEIQAFFEHSKLYKIN